MDIFIIVELLVNLTIWNEALVRIFHMLFINVHDSHQTPNRNMEKLLNGYADTYVLQKTKVSSSVLTTMPHFMFMSIRIFQEIGFLMRLKTMSTRPDPDTVTLSPIVGVLLLGHPKCKLKLH